MAGVWGVGFNHCGQIGPDFMEEDSSPQDSRPGGSRIMETDEAGSPATCKLWKPNTCWRLKQVQNLRLRTKSLPRLSRVASFLICSYGNSHLSWCVLIHYCCAAAKQVPMSSQEFSEWEVRELCAGGDFSVVHGRCVTMYLRVCRSVSHSHTRGCTCTNTHTKHTRMTRSCHAAGPSEMQVRRHGSVGI